MAICAGLSLPPAEGARESAAAAASHDRFRRIMKTGDQRRSVHRRPPGGRALVALGALLGILSPVRAFAQSAVDAGSAGEERAATAPGGGEGAQPLPGE